MTVTARLCEFAASGATSQTALAMMRLSLLDWCGCALAGQGEPAARIVRNTVMAEGGAGQAVLVGGGRAPMRAAALVNGVASHALDYDDTHFAHIGHPSVAVIPAALAVAEHTRADGAAFLDAALIGAEASIRVGVWLGRAHYQAGFHQTGTAGAFGAALAAGRLLGMDADQFAHALGLVSTRAAGLKSQFGSMGKPMNAGFAAANGVEAAALANAGFTSNALALEGAFGFGETHAGVADEAGFEGLGQDWLMQSISHKFHACCHGLHAMLEVLAKIAPGIGADEVRAVRVGTNPRWRDVCNIEAPETGLQTKFSYRHVAAMALSGVSTADLAAFSDAMANDRDLSKLRDRVEVVFEPDIAETAARVVLTMRDGSTRQGEHDLRTAMPMADRSSKIRAKVATLVGSERCDELWAAIGGGPDLGGLVEILATGSKR